MEWHSPQTPPDPTEVRRALEAVRRVLAHRGIAISISGVNGSGKTTLALNLLSIFQHHGIAVRHIHSFRWHVNVMWIPLVLLYNKYFWCRVLLFDRCVYDNIAVLASKHESWRFLMFRLTRVTAFFYPRFDYRFWLTVSLADGQLRRPQISPDAMRAALDAHEAICRQLGYIELSSNASTLSRALRILSGRRHT